MDSSCEGERDRLRLLLFREGSPEGDGDRERGIVKKRKIKTSKRQIKGAHTERESAASVLLGRCGSSFTCEFEENVYGRLRG